MADLDGIIGLTLGEAKIALNGLGINEFEVVKNSALVEGATAVVCQVKSSGGKVTLVCGDFKLFPDGENYMEAK